MKHLAYLTIALLFISCGGDGEETGENGDNSDEQSIIESPLEGDFQNDTLFKIDPTKETVVSTPNGSSIEIPANVLVDADGNLVEETVDLSFTQYHSAADILASGIPMSYDSAGTSGTFKSAGMFTIKAKADNKEVFIKDGKNIKVNLASDNPEGYSFYDMDESTGDWTYEPAERFPTPNPRWDPSAVPIEPQEADKNAFVLDLDFDLSKHPELEPFSGIVWEYVGYHDTLDPRKNSDVSSTRWTDFNLVPTYENAFEYFLTMTQQRKSFTTKVKAALQGDDFEKALADYKQKKVEIAAQMDNIQKPFIRSVNISGFGTRNWDYIHDMTDPEEMIADFDFGDKNGDKDQATVFVIYPSSNVVANYPQYSWSKFALDKGQFCHVLAILPGNYLAVHRNNNSAAFDKSEYTFQMDVLDDPLNEKGDLETAIANL